MWMAECEVAFTYVKQVPDFALPFKVYTDTSKDSVGAVLAQDDEGFEKVVAYPSQALMHTQK